MKAIERLKKFRGNYPRIQSKEGEVLSNVITYLTRATTSLSPHCDLELAKSEVYCYEMDLKRKGDSCPNLIRRLRNSISDAYDKLIPRGIST